MKRSLLFVVVIILAVSFVGCSKDHPNATYQKFDKLAGTFPHQLLFENEYAQIKGENGPRNALVVTSITVQIDSVGKFIKDLACEAFDSISAQDLQKFKELGYGNLGVCRDSTLIAGSLSKEYNAWLAAASYLGTQALKEYEFFSKMGLDDATDNGIPSSQQKINSVEQTSFNEYGSVTVCKQFDYDKAPPEGRVITF